MAKCNKAEVERKIMEERSLSRSDLCSLSYDFVKACLRKGKRIVIDLDNETSGDSLRNGTENGFEIRASSEVLSVIGTIDFNSMAKAECGKTENGEGLKDYFTSIAKQTDRNAMSITRKGSATRLVLAKANDLDALKRKP